MRGATGGDARSARWRCSWAAHCRSMPAPRHERFWLSCHRPRSRGQHLPSELAGDPARPDQAASTRHRTGPPPRLRHLRWRRHTRYRRPRRPGFRPSRAAGRGHLDQRPALADPRRQQDHNIGLILAGARTSQPGTGPRGSGMSVDRPMGILQRLSGMVQLLARTARSARPRSPSAPTHHVPPSTASATPLPKWVWPRRCPVPESASAAAGCGLVTPPALPMSRVGDGTTHPRRTR